MNKIVELTKQKSAKKRRAKDSLFNMLQNLTKKDTPSITRVDLQKDIQKVKARFITGQKKKVVQTTKSPTAIKALAEFKKKQQEPKNEDLFPIKKQLTALLEKIQKNPEAARAKTRTLPRPNFKSSFKAIKHIKNEKAT